MIPQPAGWKNVPVVAVGTEYKWLEPSWLPHWDIAVRSGYTRTENPVPAATFNPATISLSAHTLSVGLGFLCKGPGKFVGLIPCGGESAMWPKAIGFDAAYQEWFYDSFNVTGNVNSTVNGSYDASIHLGTLSFKYLF
jgi:long-chain fatty acid transport protein